MTILFANNAASTLASGITGSSTSLSVKTGDGDLYPSPSGSNYFIATIISASDNTTNEVVYVTARSDDTMTITRAQEDTSALSFSAGDYFRMVPTAGTMESFLQDVDSASTTTSGLVQLATSAETITGTDASKAVTPYGLSQKTASTSVAGLAQYATSAETITGTLTSKAVTPAGLVSRTATTSRYGLVELATDSDVLAGTSSSLAVTPSTLAALAGSTSVAGLVQLASVAEALAGTLATKAVTPAGLAGLFEYSVTSSTSFWFKFVPANLLFVRGQVSVTDDSSTPFSFTEAFADTNYGVWANPVYGSTGYTSHIIGAWGKPSTTTSATIAYEDTSSSPISPMTVDVLLFGVAAS